MRVHFETEGKNRNAGAVGLSEPGIDEGGCPHAGGLESQSQGELDLPGGGGGGGVHGMVGVAGDGGVDETSAAEVDDSGELPVVEKSAEKFVSAMKGTRFGGEGGDQAMALIGYTGAALGGGHVRILHGGGLAGHESVLTV